MRRPGVLCDMPASCLLIPNKTQGIPTEGIEGSLEIEHT